MIKCKDRIFRHFILLSWVGVEFTRYWVLEKAYQSLLRCGLDYNNVLGLNLASYC